MVNQTIAENELSNLSTQRQYNFQNWLNGKFMFLKLASATEKNDVAKEFLHNLLQRCNCRILHVSHDRQGDYDISIANSSKKKIKFKCKLATIDVKGKFQFNSIVKQGKNYTHLFCIAVLPNSIKFLFIKKGALGRPPHTMTPMSKGAVNNDKLTKTQNDMKSFQKFKAELAKL